MEWIMPNITVVFYLIDWLYDIFSMFLFTELIYDASFKFGLARIMFLRLVPI